MKNVKVDKLDKNSAKNNLGEIQTMAIYIQKHVKLIFLIFNRLGKDAQKSLS